MTPDAFIEEDRVSKDFDYRLTFRLLRYLRPYLRIIIFSSFVSLALALLQLAGPWLVKVTIDKYITTANYAGIARMSAMYVATIVLMFIFEYAQTWMIALVGQRAMFDLRADMFRHVQSQPLAFFDRHPVGRLMTRLTSDVGALNELFSQGVMTIAGDLFLVVAISLLMLKTNLIMTLLVFATAPLLYEAGRIFRKNVRESNREVRMWLSRMNAYLQENLSGIKTVQAYNREEKNFGHFRDLNENFRLANVKTVFYYAVFFPTVEVIGALALALIVWYGGVGSLHGTVTLGTVYLFIQYSQRLFQPIKDISDKFNIFQSAMAAAERVFKLLDTKPDIVSPPTAIACTGLKDRITFDNISFAYKDEQWVLRDVSFEVRKGETVALVGSTGSGKTTLTSLLARFYDVQGGAVRIDGVDVKDMDMYSLRRRMAIVLQDAFLFSGDIESNIRLGNTQITRAQVEQASRYVNAHGFISELNGGYDHEVKERGATLSVGQKQLLALARALAFDPEILILDEATASIDTETELLIQDALGKLLQNRTSIVVAHRLSTIQKADRIVVLHHGVVKEVGRHQELLQRNGIYRKLYELQYSAAGC